MTLKEQILKQNEFMENEKHKEINDDDIRRYDLFLKICEKVDDYALKHNIECDTYTEVFDMIEKNELDIYDIIAKEDYDTFKKQMIDYGVQICPHLGKYVSTKTNEFEFRRCHGGGIFFK